MNTEIRWYLFLVFNFVRLVYGDETPSSNGTWGESPIEPTHNCTRCHVWKGHQCLDSQPCAKIKHYDPLGKIIALILLTIFMLSILTLCLKVCCNVCGHANGNYDNRWDNPEFTQKLSIKFFFCSCCVLQCALSIQCCCEWKASNLRVLPEPNNDRHDPGLSGGAPALFPQPPPSYIDIFPSTTVRQG